MLANLTKKLIRASLVTAVTMCGLSVQAQGKLDYTGFQQVFPNDSDGSEYLYEATYKNYDYEAALKFTNFLCSEWNDSLFSTISASDLMEILGLPFQKPDNKTACSEVRKGNFFGRNLDGYYNSYCNLLMHIDAGEDRLASVAMGRIETLGTKTAIDHHLLPSFIMNAAPMFTSDGMNSAGVCVALNSLPRINMDRTSGTNPGKPRISEAILPRVILDKAHSVQEALDIIYNNDIFAPYNPTLGVYRELHFIIADPTRTVVVEIFGNKIYVQEAEDINNADITKVTDANIMTNMWHTQWDNDSLCEGGVERYQVLKEHYYDAPAEKAGQEEMLDLMKTVWFTQGYYQNAVPNYWVTDQMWKTPWCDMNPESTTENAKKARYQVNTLLDMISGACSPELLRKYRPSTLEGTLHTTVYDMEKKTMLLVPTQSEKKLYFEVEPNKE